MRITISSSCSQGIEWEMVLMDRNSPSAVVQGGIFPCPKMKAMNMLLTLFKSLQLLSTISEVSIDWSPVPDEMNGRENSAVDAGTASQWPENPPENWLEKGPRSPSFKSGGIFFELGAVKLIERATRKNDQNGSEMVEIGSGSRPRWPENRRNQG